MNIFNSCVIGLLLQLYKNKAPPTSLDIFEIAFCSSSYCYLLDIIVLCFERQRYINILDLLCFSLK